MKQVFNNLFDIKNTKNLFNLNDFSSPTKFYYEF